MAEIGGAAKALGQRIRELRREKGWSQEQLAEYADMHRTYMWGIEQGVRNPSLRHLTKIAEALGVPIAALFTPQWVSARATADRYPTGAGSRDI